MTQIKNIGLFTSGGDAPGMNAAIRAVVRSAYYYGIDVTGIRRGYEGMINGEIFSMDRKSVANIIQRGGTILKTARSEQFRTPQGRKLRALMQSFKVNNSNYWDVWIDREFISLHDNIQQDVWDLSK